MSASAFRLRPSGADIWVNCHGAVVMQEQFPEVEGPEAMEGTAAHFAATEPLQGRPVKTGDVAPNGIVITDEMMEGAALYQSVVMQRIPWANMRVEQTLPIPDIHPENGGTPDTWGIGFEPYVIQLIDYKYGHDFVEVFENWQLAEYISGIFSHLVATGHFALTAEAHLTIEFTIVQPRSYHRDGPVRTWRVRLDHLRGMFNLLRHAAEMAFRDDVTTTAGGWCEHCTARIGCETLQQSSYSIMRRIGRATPFNLDPLQVGRELYWINQADAILSARRKALEIEAFSMLESGKGVPHFEIDRAPGSEKWNEGKEQEVISLAAALGKDIRKPVAAITPTQARALGMPDAVIAAYAARPKGKAKLVPLDTTKTRKIFGAK